MRLVQSMHEAPRVQKEAEPRRVKHKMLDQPSRSERKMVFSGERDEPTVAVYQEKSNSGVNVKSSLARQASKTYYVFR